MTIPYRTRRILKRTAVGILVAAVVLGLLWLGWVIWLGRYVVYTQDGARLDLSSSSLELAGTAAQKPEEETVAIYYNEGDSALDADAELAQLAGYYITSEDLGDIPAVTAQLQKLPAGTAVMVDVKDGKGSFFYSSDITTARSSSIDPEAMDELIKTLTDGRLYAIARISALQDYRYGLNNVDDGLFSASGAYLWQDSEGCYWLNPSREGTVSYLVQIIKELRSLGFDEVVLDRFCFPGSDRYVFSGDRQQTLANVAQTLVTSCAGERFGVSFVGSSSFPLPDGRSRLYVADADASDAAAIADATGLADPAVRLVFMTQLHDTRFDTYGVLRPLGSAE